MCRASALPMRQMLDGNLYEVVGDKQFNGKFKAIVEKIV